MDQVGCTQGSAHNVYQRYSNPLKVLKLLFRVWSDSASEWSSFLSVDCGVSIVSHISNMFLLSSVLVLTILVCASRFAYVVIFPVLSR